MGSIVEGCDFGTMTYPLYYPFLESDYGDRIKAVEAEASALWDWCNVPKDKTGRRNPNGKTDAERGLDAPDLAMDFGYETGERSS